MVTLNTTQTTVITMTNTTQILMALAGTTPANQQTLETIRVLIGEASNKYLLDALVNFMPEAYNGLNRDAGDWAKELIKLQLNQWDY